VSITAERPIYVPRRRYADRPAEVRVARHRASEAFAVALVAQLVELAIALWSATMSPRAVARLIVIVGFAVLIVLGLGALIIGGPSPAVPPGQVVTPSPTPFPGGWTYGPR
jgi:hypothetical protein